MCSRKDDKCQQKYELNFSFTSLVSFWLDTKTLTTMVLKFPPPAVTY